MDLGEWLRLSAGGVVDEGDSLPRLLGPEKIKRVLSGERGVLGKHSEGNLAAILGMVSPGGSKPLGWIVRDTQGGKVIGVYRGQGQARAKVDKLDDAYGGVRYTMDAIWPETLEKLPEFVRRRFSGPG